MPKFVLKDMEGLYIEEMNAAINLLKVGEFLLAETKIRGEFLLAEPKIREKFLLAEKMGGEFLLVH